MAFRKILIPLDGSKLSELALQTAAKVAAPGATIHILSVEAADAASEVGALSSAAAYGSSATPQWPYINGVSDLHQDEARRSYLKKVAEWLFAAEYDVRISIRTGAVAESILDEASTGCECIIMASHQRTGMTKTVLGSVTEAVLQRAICPVLVVPGK